jgi:hypothetical protein
VCIRIGFMRRKGQPKPARVRELGADADRSSVPNDGATDRQDRLFGSRMAKPHRRERLPPPMMMDVGWVK